MDALDDHDLVFVGGLHRSGTTLLADLLAGHPDAAGLEDTGVPADEGQHLQEAIPRAKDVGGAGRFGLRDGGPLTEASELVTDEVREALGSAWRPHWDLSKRVLVEKSPPNLVRTRFLQALFPGSRFVLLVRHPAAVALATHKWSVVNTVHQQLKHWVTCHERLREDLPHLEHAHVLKYEDLVADPEAALEGVWSFLGLDPVDPSEEIRPDVNEKYFARWRDRREGLLDRFYIRWLEGRFEEDVRRFGYSLRDLEDVAPWPEGGTSPVDG